MEKTFTYTVSLDEVQNTNLTGMSLELGMTHEELLLESHLVGLRKIVEDTFGPLSFEEEYEDEESRIEEEILDRLEEERLEREASIAQDSTDSIDYSNLTKYSKEDLEQLFAWFIKDNFNPYAPHYESFDQFCIDHHDSLKRYDVDQAEITEPTTPPAYTPHPSGLPFP